MTSSTLDKVKLLPASKQQEVEDFVEFLVSKYSAVDESLNSLDKHRMQIMGRYENKIHMSDDFNQTPIDFQDYL